MKAYEQISAKQIEWARNNGIDLIGSKGDRGRPAYTRILDDNLYKPLNPRTERSFREGDGSELTGTPAKMQAVHSSSALSVNIFQFWDSFSKAHQIARSCGFCYRTTQVSQRISFEVKYPISDSFGFSPNIDVVIENTPAFKHKVYAIECKFTEAYGGRGHSGLKEKYLDLDIWDGLPYLHKLSISISPKDCQFQYLHVAQLIKHILGLKRALGKPAFRLLYLWCDAMGIEGAQHREEIDEFLVTAKSDGIAIHALSYQELIVRLASEYRVSHKEYIEYITSRYL
jgi:hypothetical protein